MTFNTEGYGAGKIKKYLWYEFFDLSAQPVLHPMIVELTEAITSDSFIWPRSESIIFPTLKRLPQMKNYSFFQAGTNIYLHMSYDKQLIDR